jgi:hypothetical protein
MDGLCGLISMAASVAVVTVRVPDPVIVPEVAVIVVIPGVTLVAYPAAPIVATAGTDDAHAAVCVKSCVLPSV